MQPPMSFAPLAGRLAAKAAEIRPVAGAKVSWANFMALFWCAIFEMLILLCEALDARAAADAARALAAPAPQDVRAAVVPASRAERQAPSSEKHAAWLTLAPAVQALTSKPDDAPAETTGRPVPADTWLAWSHDPGPIWAVLAPPWRLAEKRGFRARSSARLFYYIIVTNTRRVGWNALHSTPRASVRVT